MAEFIWTKPKEVAAQLIAEGELRDAEIAAKGEVNVERQTLWNWRQAPEFAARVEEHLAKIRAVCQRRAVSFAERRVERLNRDWLRMQRVIEERAEDPRLAHVPGGSTGLIVHNVKGVGRGDDFQLIDLYEVDTGLLRELREHEKQAAQELGQWADKHEFSDARASEHRAKFEAESDLIYGSGDEAVPGDGEGAGVPEGPVR